MLTLHLSPLNHIFNVESTICLKLDLFCGFSRQNCNLTHSSDGVKMPGFLFWNRSTCTLILNATGRYAISPFLLSCIIVWYSLNKMFLSRIHQILLILDFYLAFLNLVIPEVLQFVKWIQLPGLDMHLLQMKFWH